MRRSRNNYKPYVNNNRILVSRRLLVAVWSDSKINSSCHEEGLRKGAPFLDTLNFSFHQCCQDCPSSSCERYKKFTRRILKKSLVSDCCDGCCNAYTLNHQSDHKLLFKAVHSSFRTCELELLDYRVTGSDYFLYRSESVFMWVSQK